MSSNSNDGNGKIDYPSPELLVLGDHMRELFVYDMRPPKHKARGPRWTPPLSQDMWRSAQGFEMRRCVGGAAAVHAMLGANGAKVDGNAFASGWKLEDPSGCVYVLHKRSNPSNKKRQRTRKYLSVQLPPERKSRGEGQSEKSQGCGEGQLPPEKPEASGEGQRPPQILERSYTWRIRDSFLTTPGQLYVDLQPREDEQGNTTHPPTFVKSFKETPRYACLFDVGRGSNTPGDLDKWASSKATSSPPHIIVIRTHDPSRFRGLLEEKRKHGKGAVIVFVCPIADLNDGNLRGAGTWTDVWLHAYSYLCSLDNLLLSDGADWAAHIIVPIYQDGAVWFGPDQWAFSPEHGEPHRNWFKKRQYPPIGRLFVLPGSQPRLFDFREPALGLGPTTLMVFTLLQKILDKQNQPVTDSQLPEVLESAVKCALTRVRRFHDRGYCRVSKREEPNELTPIPDSPAPELGLYIPYPRELWAKGESRYTDALVGPMGGAYEVTCTLPKEVLYGKETILEAFAKLQKKIGLRDQADLVAAPDQCARVVKLKEFEKSANDNRTKYCHVLGNEDPQNNDYPIDRFVDEEIKNFESWRRASMQFGDMTIANPDDSGPILDLVHKMQEHVMQHRYLPAEDGKVFSFALFGTPGSGKSTLAREIQRAVDPGDEIFKRLEFNISQFAGKEQLIHAFEEVAHQGLGGKVPLVLWDEFDTVYDGKRGGWLSHFLMPMQDAKYFERYEEKLLGTAVFVFIGGTFPDASAFRRWASGVDVSSSSPTNLEGTPESVLLKARDFHSRLFMSLNMPSMIYVDRERSEERNATVQRIQDKSLEEDYPKLARSVFLRYLFQDRSKVDGKSRTREIEEYVLQVLLNIPLRHGARSLERIVEACLVNKPDKLSRHHLPPLGFLEEHIETTQVVAMDDPGWSPSPRNPVVSILEKIEKIWL